METKGYLVKLIIEFQSKTCEFEIDVDAINEEEAEQNAIETFISNYIIYIENIKEN